MSLPTITAPAADPIDIDPGVAYKCVLPVRGETSLNVLPLAGFTLALSGHTLTVTYTGDLLSVPTTFNIAVHASNGEGTTVQILHFKVSGSRLIHNVALAVHFTGSSTDCTLDVGPPTFAVGDMLRVQDKTAGDSTGIDANKDGLDLFVVYLSGATFRLSLTSGGAAIVNSNSSALPYEVVIITTRASNDTLYVGPTAGLAVDELIELAFSDGGLIAPEVRGYVYVKTIVDGYRIKVAATAGGTALVPSTVTAPAITTLGQAYTLYLYLAPHNSLALTSAGEINPALGGAVNYSITSDLTADELDAEDLPSWLSIAAGVISGTAPAVPGYFVILLVAEKGASVSYRYLIVTVGSGIAPGAAAALQPDLSLDLLTRDVLPYAIPGNVPNRVILALGDTALILAFVRDGAPATLAIGANVRLRVNPLDSIDPTQTKLEAALDLTAESFVISLAEDWSALAAAMTANKPYTDFSAQYEWRAPDDTFVTVGAFTANSGTDVLTLVAHGLKNGQCVQVSNSGGALPAGLAAATMYYVRDVTTDTFKLAATLGGAAIDLTTNGTGTNTLKRALFRKSKIFVFRVYASIF